jgi:hypothetical protein
MFARVMFFLKPGWGKVAITCVALLLTLLVITNIKETSGMSYEEKHGAPLHFLLVEEYRGPRGKSVQGFLPVGFTLDLAGWYLASCIIVSACHILQRQREKKTIFARLLRFLWPGWGKVAITCMALLLSLLVVADRRAVSMSGIIWK